MNIGDAVDALRSGRRVAREEWAGKDMYLEFLHGRFFGGPVIALSNRGHFIPYACSQADLLADDWMFVCEENPPMQVPSRNFEPVYCDYTQTWRCN
jgi:hypothetical protein